MNTKRLFARMARVTVYYAFSIYIYILSVGHCLSLFASWHSVCDSRQHERKGKMGDGHLLNIIHMCCIQHLLRSVYYNTVKHI